LVLEGKKNLILVMYGCITREKEREREEGRGVTYST
jgi:hypothetical protein